MAWVNWAYVNLVILKNGVEIERNSYRAFMVTNNIITNITNMFSDGSSNLSTVKGYAAPDISGYEPWSFAAAELAQISGIFNSAYWESELTTSGDYFTFYNPNVGPRYALHIRRYNNMYFELGRTFAGTTTWDSVNRIQYGRSGNFDNGAAIGFLADGFTCYPFLMVWSHRVNTSQYGGDVRPWSFDSKSSFNSTNKYNYYFVVSDAWQPPTPPGPGGNPYADGGTSEPSGDPTGDYDDSSDVISVPSVPSFNLGITSLINVWVPSTTDINNLASYLWSNFDLTDPTKTLSKMFTDPLSYILSLHMLPFTVDSSTAITVTLAGLATTVSMPPATVQFKDIDCGSVTINEYWGNYLDYTYTKIVLCLPFCGQVDLDPDEVMGKTIKVKYRVDIITGAFVCFVYIDGDKVLGQYAGNCAAQIPISAADFSRLNAAVLGVAGAAASAFGSAALGGHGGMLNGASGGLISSIAANAQNAKIRAQHSGGLTGAPGFMGIQKPYLIIHRPRQSVPEDYEQFKGYPSNVTMQLSSCTGFTSVREITLNGLPFTDGELSELKSILEGGVIL